MNVGEAKSDRELVRACEQLRHDRLNTRRPQEAVWWNNIAFYAGDHYAEWNSQQSQFFEPAKEPHQVRLVINQARVIARQEIAKITKARPVMDVIPRSSDEVDIAAAKVGSFVLDASESKFNLRRKRRNCVRWMIVAGVAGMYVGYDPNDDKDGMFELIIDPATGDPTWHPARLEELRRMADAGEIELVTEQWPLGDIEYRVYSPFQMLPDDTVTDWDLISDIIVTDTVELELAKDTWRNQARNIQPSNSEKAGLLNRVLRRSGFVESSGDTASQTVNIHTYWLKPGIYNGEYLDKGKMIRWCGQDVILEAHDVLPFSDGELPFAFFTHTANPISIWPDTTLQDIRPINLELDKTISQLLENRDYMVNPMWAKAAQSQVGKIKSQPGGEVNYVHVRDVPPPSPIPGTPLPTQIENLVVGLRDMVLDVSGSGEVSRGRVPSGVRAGNMLAFLQEQDETQIGPIVEDFEDSVARMATLTLSRYSQFYHSERLLRAYRPGGRSDVRKFKGADLRGNTDVVVQAGSALPKLKAAKQQYVLQLVELGIERDPKRIRDWLELGDAEPDEIDLAFAQADRENDMMLRSVVNQLDPAEQRMLEEQGGAAIPQQELPGMGGPLEMEGMMTAAMGRSRSESLGETAGSSLAVPVKTWHIHEAHVARHRRVMMGPEFERMALTHPDVVRIFDEHVAMHEQAIQQQQMQQMQMMLLARGGPEATTPPPEAQPAAAATEVAQRNGGM